MKFSATCTLCKQIACFIIFLFLSLLQFSAGAQCTTNILTNPSFETPVVPTLNGNNLVGSSWGGWTSQNGAGLNIIKVNGTTYTSGADNAAQGNQYLDIAGASDYPLQSFTISTPSICYFSGKFSNRETGSGFVNWTARVDILNSSNAVVASSNSKVMTTTTDMETWYMMSGESTTLAAGTYKYRAFVGDYGHFDDAFLCVTAASAVCTNRIPEASFETPVQSSDNAATSVGTISNNWYTQNGSNINLTKVDGTGYALGPDVAYQGSQYASLSGSNDYLVRNFTVTCPTTLNFSGYFANRPNGTYSNWTGIIEILNASNAVVASSTTQAFTSATPQEIWYLVSGTSSTLPVGTYKYRVALGREGNFDGGYLCVASSSCVVMPVTWASFDVKKDKQSIILDWVTAQEQNTVNFIVQHSLDGKDWNNIGRVNGAGNSLGERKYSFTHNNISNGNHYYRIQQKDADGKQSFSEIKRISFSSITSSFNINHSSVSSGSLQIELSDTQTLSLYSSDGNLLLQKKLAAGKQFLDVSRFAKGTYLLNNGQETKKFVIR